MLKYSPCRLAVSRPYQAAAMMPAVSASATNRTAHWTRRRETCSGMSGARFVVRYLGTVALLPIQQRPEHKRHQGRARQRDEQGGHQPPSGAWHDGGRGGNGNGGRRATADSQIDQPHIHVARLPPG